MNGMGKAVWFFTRLSFFYSTLCVYVLSCCYTVCIGRYTTV